jgi:hypothetical protein
MFSILDPFGLFNATSTKTVGGGASSEGKAPWYVTPLVVLVIVAMVIYAGKKLVDKAVK